MTSPIWFILVILFNIIILLGEIRYITHSNTAKYGYDLDKLKSTDDYKQALESCYSKKSPLEKEIRQAIAQITSITKKRTVLQEFNKLLTEVSQLDDTSTDETFSSVLTDMTNSLKTLRGEEL